MKKLTLDAQALCSKYGCTEISHGLSLYLQNLSRGRRMTPHSWLYEKDDSVAVLNSWIEIMKAANNKTEWGEAFNRFDLKQVEKFGPQGGIPPIASEDCWKVVEPLYSSSEFDDPQRLSHLFDRANAFGQELFGALKLRHRPLTPEAVVRDMARRDTLTTNSGFPRFTKRFKTQALEIADAKTPLALLYPAIILFRYYYGKLRPVWMFPMATNLNEASYALPSQSRIASSHLEWVRDYCTPWLGFEHVKRVLTKQWSPNTAIVGGDTTKMDAHMRPAQMQLVYEILKWGFQKAEWAKLHETVMHVNDIDLLYGIDEKSGKTVVLEGVHGLASGSSWTQLSETVLQLFMAYSNGVRGQGIGDDFYWISDMTADDLVTVLSEYGLPANPAKQSVSTNSLTFLQRYFHQGFFSREDSTVLGAYYPTIRALGSMLMPEKFHDPKEWSSDMFCIRVFMILENCVDNPCFVEFVKFVMRGHKDLIPFAKKTAKELNLIQRVARRVSGLFPNYNQEKLRKPLSSFASIREARAL